MTPQEQLKYENALKKVKKIRRFYKHLLVYVVINVMIIIVNFQNLEQGESYFQLKNFLTAFIWGIFIVVQGLSVFGSEIFFGINWEERKINELMEKEKNNKWE